MLGFLVLFGLFRFGFAWFGFGLFRFGFFRFCGLFCFLVVNPLCSTRKRQVHARGDAPDFAQRGGPGGEGNA